MFSNIHTWQWLWKSVWYAGRQEDLALVTQLVANSLRHVTPFLCPPPKNLPGKSNQSHKIFSISMEVNQRDLRESVKGRAFFYEAGKGKKSLETWDFIREVLFSFAWGPFFPQLRLSWCFWLIFSSLSREFWNLLTPFHLSISFFSISHSNSTKRCKVRRRLVDLNLLQADRQAGFLVKIFCRQPDRNI